LRGHDDDTVAVSVFEEIDQHGCLLVRVRSQAEVVELCGVPHNSTHVEHFVM
jgi:hypothetical protein